ncbi:MAG: fibro-slime domain-containing protein [Polyangiaceae bacterium]|nr:fibro-slime domain-containing protein [Polyangiaceae bacterium]
MKTPNPLFFGITALGAASMGCSAADSTGPGAFGTGGAATGGAGTGGTELISTGGTTGSGLGDGIIRDFPATFPDFIPCDEPGVTTKWCASDDDEYGKIVGDTLGTDGKPYYLGPAEGTDTTFGAGHPPCGGVPCFDHWYRTDPAYNIQIPYHIDFSPGEDGIYTYDNQYFFPIDNQGYGNDLPTNPEHNYGFTFELHASFTYRPGLEFTFIGDDDVFVFINGAKVIDLGGIHEAAEATVPFDSLGLSAGQLCTLDFYFAERKPTDSHFRIDVSPELVTVIR